MSSIVVDVRKRDIYTSVHLAKPNGPPGKISRQIGTSVDLKKLLRSVLVISITLFREFVDNVG